MSLIIAAMESVLHPKGMISFLSNCSVLLEVLSAWQKHSSKSYWDQPAGQSSSPEALLAHCSGCPILLFKTSQLPLGQSKTTMQKRSSLLVPHARIRLFHPHLLLHALGWCSLKSEIPALQCWLLPSLLSCVGPVVKIIEKGLDRNHRKSNTSVNPVALRRCCP